MVYNYLSSLFYTFQHKNNCLPPKTLINPPAIPLYMSTWNIEKYGRHPKLNKPVLIEGLPGIGNVGKVAVDFLVDELKAEKIYEFFSYRFPHTVFVNEENLVELPKIELYYKKMKKQDILLLSGDLQPVDEESCFEFCDILLEICNKLGCKEVVALGGIGLSEAPKKPKVYCTANNKAIIKKYQKDTKIDNKIYGIVGPIIGVSGITLGMADKYKINAIALLAETLGNPMYLGIKGAKEILGVLNTKLGLNLDLKEIEKEIKNIEKEALKKAAEIDEIKAKTSMEKMGGNLHKDVNYIG